MLTRFPKTYSVMYPSILKILNFERKGNNGKVFLKYSKLDLEIFAEFLTAVEDRKRKYPNITHFLLVNKNGQEDCEVIYKDKSLFTINFFLFLRLKKL